MAVQNDWCVVVQLCERAQCCYNAALHNARPHGGDACVPTQGSVDKPSRTSRRQDHGVHLWCASFSGDGTARLNQRPGLERRLLVGAGTGRVPMRPEMHRTICKCCMACVHMHAMHGPLFAYRRAVISTATEVWLWSDCR